MLEKKKVYSILGGLIGLGFILFSLVIINGEGNNKKKIKDIQKTQFDVKRVKTKKKIKKIARKLKKKVRPKINPPNLSNVLNGASFGLGQFEFLDESTQGLLNDNSHLTMSKDTVDEAPAVNYMPPLEYPDYARKRAIEGYVLFNMLIGVDGSVENVKVLNSQPEGVFDQVAKKNILEWQFEAAKYKGKKVKVWVEQKISFNLN